MSEEVSGLVGYSGLVGSTLLRRRDYSVLVNSSNVSDLQGRHFAEIVFSAARAEKWRANAEPAADRAHIDDLIELLGSFTADRLTLISTVDVYARPLGVDEATRIDVEELHPYGAGRYRLERAAVSMHPQVLVLRLPALFGKGLKKNVVYDLLHDNQVDRIQPGSEFQWYDLERLHDDIEAVWTEGQGLVNLVPEPIATSRIVSEAFGRDALDARGAAPPVKYDIRTVRSALFGTAGPYIERADAVVGRLKAFVRTGSAP